MFSCPEGHMYSEAAQGGNSVLICDANSEIMFQELVNGFSLEISWHRTTIVDASLVSSQVVSKVRVLDYFGGIVGSNLFSCGWLSHLSEEDMGSRLVKMVVGRDFGYIKLDARKICCGWLLKSSNMVDFIFCTFQGPNSHQCIGKQSYMLHQSWNALIK